MASKNIDKSTEEKIIAAARKVFTEKGYAAARTRDIAEAAGINLALLNYYFRSKEKLFDIIMLENLKQFMGVVRKLINDEHTSLEQKLEAVAGNYIDMLMKQPSLPLFILTEIRNHPQKLIANMGVKNVLKDSVFMKQLASAGGKSGTAPHPLHMLLNLLSMVIFPFAASPIVQAVGDLDSVQFNQLMLERKKLIPGWVKTLLEAG